MFLIIMGIMARIILTIVCAFTFIADWTMSDGGSSFRFKILLVAFILPALIWLWAH
jgi:hypothetical protein